MNFETIPLSRLKELLGLKGKGNRSVVAWCRRNNVIIIGKGCTSRILSTDWDNVNKSQYLKRLKSIYPSNWKDLAKQHGMAVQEELPIETSSYKPRTAIAREFMSDE